MYFRFSAPHPSGFPEPLTPPPMRFSSMPFVMGGWIFSGMTHSKFLYHIKQTRLKYNFSKRTSYLCCLKDSMHSLHLRSSNTALSHKQFHTRNETDSDHRSYQQLLGRILWANSLGKDYPGPPTSLQDFAHGKHQSLNMLPTSSIQNFCLRNACQVLKTSTAHLSLYCVLLGLDCTSKESSSCTLLGGQNRQDSSSANPSMFRN